MNWLDILILVLIITNMLRGYSFGLMLSLFNLLQVVISIFITKSYYMAFYGFMKGNDFLLSIFNRIVYFVFRIIFYRKDKLNPGFLDGLIKTDIMNLILIGFSILFVYKVSTIIIDILFSLFSFLLDIRIFKRIDKYGGMLFGLLKGILSLIIVNEVFRPILLEMPGLMFSEVFLNSKFLNLIMLKTSSLEGGMIYEKTRYIFWNITSMCRGIISTI